MLTQIPLKIHPFAMPPHYIAIHSEQIKPFRNNLVLGCIQDGIILSKFKVPSPNSLGMKGLERF